MSDAAFRDFVERAKRVSVRDELMRRGLWNERTMSHDRGVPCPSCGGTDRFAVNTRKDIFNCRKCGGGAGAIALAMKLDATDFVTACETVSGEQRPDGRQQSAEERRACEERVAELHAQAQVKALEDAREQARYRERERQRAHELWQAAVPIAGTLAEAQLRLRGLVAPPEAKLRFLPNAALWNKPANVPGARIVHQGPARVAAIQGPDNSGAGLRFAGVQLNWIDMSDADGKARIADPERPGHLVAAKKVRGSHKGGSILWGKAQSSIVGPPSHQGRVDREAIGVGSDATLQSPPGRCAATLPSGEGVGAEHIWLAEGLETVGSVHNWLKEIGSPLLPLSEFRACVSLANLAGKAAGRARHPSLTYVARGGHVRPVLVPDSEPHPQDGTPLIALPDSVTHLWLIRDGDSEAFFTALAIERAAKRYAAAYPHLTIHALAAEPGKDFNDQWREQIERAAA